ncbi:MAG: hypothetical protein AAFQ98_03715 [Bacteroidota bacterium]
MLPELKCLTEAASKLGLPYQVHDRNGNLITLEVGGHQYLFERNYTSFNTETEARICLDKEHTYQLLHKVIPMPATLGFFDPHQATQYEAYKHQTSVAQMVQVAEEQFGFPQIIKRNRGALGSQVYMAQSAVEAENAFQAIFNREDKDYDYVALAQQFITTEREFRAVFFRGRLLLAYERFAGQRAFKANYWQLPEGRSLLVKESALLEQIQGFVKPIFKVFPISWVGVDLLVDSSGGWYLLELNSGPRFQHFIQNHGTAEIVHLYSQVLKEL